MHILLVEDDRQLRTSIARGLREASHSAEQASSGEQALSLAAGTTFDLIILDLLLPDMSGLEVCRGLRSHGNRVPILMLTALDAVEQRIAGLDAGADDYLTKPFDFGELLARLRALTRRHDVVPPNIVIGDLTIDNARRTAHRAGLAISLTAKEFSLLSYLARNVGRVVSRAELLRNVWDDPRNSYSNIIDVYAARLRRKLDEGAKIPLFVTVRGAGFMLDAPAVREKPKEKKQPSRGRK
jgi:two-component system copper resistance phosphate regulon response regulator CusR